ncbi:hypothetical protein BNJ_00126 [Kaumoebavirus]|uniref:hypothetical protein n=1 Tax=Kaumoebavirus TaxID=1859492 RepID=UPI0009C1CD1B|nr:hypothetical protein BNJ_00126 [Kaumoebavirus]ARA71959.1 hypothetical protein BNJ_00126 [Kaumoebavirus]
MDRYTVIFPEIYAVLREYFCSDVAKEILGHAFDGHPIFKKMVPVIKYGRYVPADGKIYFTHSMMADNGRFERLYDDRGKYCGSTIYEGDSPEDWFRFGSDTYHSKFSTIIEDGKLIWQRKNQ